MPGPADTILDLPDQTSTPPPAGTYLETGGPDGSRKLPATPAALGAMALPLVVSADITAVVWARYVVTGAVEFTMPATRPDASALQTGDSFEVFVTGAGTAQIGGDTFAAPSGLGTQAAVALVCVYESPFWVVRNARQGLADSNLSNVNPTTGRNALGLGASAAVAFSSVDAETVEAGSLYANVEFGIGNTSIFAASPDSVTLYMPEQSGNIALNPMTETGDMVVGGAGGLPARLAAGTAGQVLVSAGAGAPPAWGTPAAPAVNRYDLDWFYGSGQKYRARLRVVAVTRNGANWDVVVELHRDLVGSAGFGSQPYLYTRSSATATAPIPGGGTQRHISYDAQINPVRFGWSAPESNTRQLVWFESDFGNSPGLEIPLSNYAAPDAPVPVYADDAAADADGALLSGSLYSVTGDRTVYRKP